MKKLIAIGLAAIMILSLAACGASEPKQMTLKEFEKPIAMLGYSACGRLELDGYALDEVRTEDKKLVSNGLFVYGKYTNTDGRTNSFDSVSNLIIIEALQHGKSLKSFTPLLPADNDAIPGGFEKWDTKVDINVSYMIGRGFQLEDKSPVTIRISDAVSGVKEETTIDPEGENKDTGK